MKSRLRSRIVERLHEESVRRMRSHPSWAETRGAAWGLRRIERWNRRMIRLGPRLLLDPRSGLIQAL